jgi:hypothetical protein
MMAYVHFFKEVKFTDPYEKWYEYIRQAFVGDDVVNSSILTGFDNVYVCKYQDSVGYATTSADKKSAIEASKDYKEVTFLKRRFVIDGERVLAPLDEDSIYKMLCYKVLPSHCSDEEHEKSILNAAQREFFLHGEEKFDDFQELMKDNKLYNAGLTYEKLSKEYDDDRFQMWDSEEVDWIVLPHGKKE